MEKRIILAIGLSILVLLGWGKLFPPPERQALPPAQVDTQSPAQVEDTRTERPRSEVQDVTLPDPDEPVAEVVAAETSQEIRITNDLYEAVLTNRGAGLLSWKLRQFRTSEGDPLEVRNRDATQDDEQDQTPQHRTQVENIMREVAHEAKESTGLGSHGQAPNGFC